MKTNKSNNKYVHYRQYLRVNIYLEIYVFNKCSKLKLNFLFCSRIFCKKVSEVGRRGVILTENHYTHFNSLGKEICFAYNVRH